MRVSDPFPGVTYADWMLSRVQHYREAHSHPDNENVQIVSISRRQSTAPYQKPDNLNDPRQGISMPDDGIDPIAGALAVHEWRPPFVLALPLLGLELNLEFLDLHTACDQELLDAG
jgi:hypothetical protein